MSNSSSILSDDIFRFLNSTKIVKKCDKLINKYSNSKELYMKLRSESTQLIKKDKDYYKVVLDPYEDELWEETKNYKKFKQDKKNNYLKQLWPSGDYHTYEDFLDYDDLKPLIYSIETNIPYYFSSWDDIEFETSDESLDYPASIYICFVIPFIMAKHSLKYNQKPNKGTFIFLTVSGGAGALVKTKRNGYKAISCGHTFDLDNTSTKMIKDKQYIIMLNDGKLAILGNAKIMYNEKKEIDAGMADVITTLDKKYFIDIESSMSVNDAIMCYGSPSIIQDADSNCGRGEKEKIIIGPKSGNLSTDVNICWWDPLFFHEKDGKIIKVNDYTIYHNAIVWQGMSGGPIFSSDGRLLGLHHLEDDGLDESGKKVTEPYGIAMRADVIEEFLFPVKVKKTKKNSRGSTTKTKFNS